MAEDKNSGVIQNQDRINKLIDGLTLFDDDLMSRVFDKNIEATELLLRIILERMYMHWMKTERKWTLRYRETPKVLT